jgi:hypothetical protein
MPPCPTLTEWLSKATTPEERAQVEDLHRRGRCSYCRPMGALKVSKKAESAEGSNA